jgi:hypothetical protein
VVREENTLIYGSFETRIARGVSVALLTLGILKFFYKLGWLYNSE